MPLNLAGRVLLLPGPQAMGSSQGEPPITISMISVRAPDQVDSLVATHSVTQDRAERYLLAADGDLAAAHRLLQTSRV